MSNYKRLLSVRLFLLRNVVLSLTLLSGQALSQQHPFTSSFAPTPYGRFVGTLILVPDGEGGRMRLQAPYEYIDPAGGTWLAPAGTISDGASIPKFAKSFIGGGWDGRYLHAAVIHDVACVEKRRPWELVHLAFYNAMLASGVDATTAKIMYAAVYHFGPRWTLGGDSRKPPPRREPTARAHAGPQLSGTSTCTRMGGFLGSICIPNPSSQVGGAKDMGELPKPEDQLHQRASELQIQEIKDSETFFRLAQEIKESESRGKRLTVEEIQNLK